MKKYKWIYKINSKNDDALLGECITDILLLRFLDGLKFLDMK